MSMFVVVPFFNQPSALAACISALQSQTESFCAVLVDDGSTDPAIDAVLSGITDDARFVVLRFATNRGPAAARHEGLSYVLTRSREDRDVVVLVDGDDHLANAEALAMLHQTYDSAPALKMTFGAMRAVPPLPFDNTPYSDWMIRWRLSRWMSWRAPHPRTVRLDHLRACWADLRVTYPDGSWLRGASDMALIFPLLDRCRPGEVRTLSTLLYVYHSGPSDGRPSLAQVNGERFVRGRVATALVRWWQHSPRILKRLVRSLLP